MIASVGKRHAVPRGRAAGHVPGHARFGHRDAAITARGRRRLALRQHELVGVLERLRRCPPGVIRRRHDVAGSGGPAVGVVVAVARRDDQDPVVRVDDLRVAGDAGRRPAARVANPDRVAFRERDREVRDVVKRQPGVELDDDVLVLRPRAQTRDLGSQVSFSVLVDREPHRAALRGRGGDGGGSKERDEDDKARHRHHDDTARLDQPH